MSYSASGSGVRPRSTSNAILGSQDGTGMPSRSAPNLVHFNTEYTDNDTPGPSAQGASSFGQPISFKRRPKPRSRFGLSSLFGSSENNSSPPPHQTTRSHSSPQVLRDASTSTSINPTTSQKNGGPQDWYIEGPGRRVGYDNLTAIDWIFEYTKERQRIRHLNSSSPGVFGYVRRLLDASHIWIVLILTGLAVGLLAGCIDIASSWLADAKLGYCRAGTEGGKFYLNRSFCCWGYEDQAKCQHWVLWNKALNINSKVGGFVTEYTIFTFYSILFATSAGLLVTTYATHARHSGIPEIKTVLGGFVIKRFMGLWTLIIKSLGLPFDSLNHNEARKREILSAAAAAGISVAFGSPIGGVLFSLEQLSYYFPDKTMWQSFVCAMAGAMTLHAINPFRTGKIVLYQVTYSRVWHRFEILPFVCLGILGGLYGGMFIKLNMKVSKWRKERTSRFPIIEVISVALITALINFPNTFMRAQLSELLYSLFAECAQVSDDRFGLCKSGSESIGVISLLVLAALLGFLLSSITFGLNIPAGVILPSLAIGALYGRALGIAFEMWQKAHPKSLFFADCEPDLPCITPGTYAIIGAAAALGGATRMTVSIVVIMFELTGALTYVIPIMIAVMLSKWCGDIFGKRGIYESWIHFNEYPFLDQKDDTPPPDVPVSQAMTSTKDLTVITAVGHTIESLTHLLSTTSFRGFPVVADLTEPTLLGYISRNELSYALKPATSRRPLSAETQVYFSHQPFADPLETLDLRPWMDQTPITLNSNASFQVVLNMFQRLGLRYVLLVNRGMLEGFLTKKDIWNILNGAKGHLTSESFREGEGEQERSLLSRNPSPMVSPLEDRNTL
ncbi:hypothetical protein FQN57_001631 [Myotisia sp. PD_48]|nr:hypothetical protein FQN57_001631 [Myotisia sp. PD_48]